MEYHELTSPLCVWILGVLCSWVSLDPISVLQSPMSLILQKTHNSLLAGDTHLSKSKPKLTANVEMQMEQQIKTYFSFFPRPRLRVYNKSLLSQVPRTASVARSYWHTIMFQSHRHVSGSWETARGHVPRVSLEIPIVSVSRSPNEEAEAQDVSCRCYQGALLSLSAFLFMTRLCPTLHQDDGN